MWTNIQNTLTAVAPDNLPPWANVEGAVGSNKHIDQTEGNHLQLTFWACWKTYVFRFWVASVLPKTCSYSPCSVTKATTLLLHLCCFGPQLCPFSPLILFSPHTSLVKPTCTDCPTGRQLSVKTRRHSSAPCSAVNISLRDQMLAYSCRCTVPRQRRFQEWLILEGGPWATNAFCRKLFAGYVL